MSDKLVSIETVKGLFRLIPANMPFEIAECLLNGRLNALPAADVKPVVRGEWERHWNITFGWVWECSSCGQENFSIYKFCPNCGAEMRKEAKE